MLTKLALPCAPAKINNESTIYNGRRLIGEFDSTDFAGKAATFDLGTVSDRIQILYHLDPHPRDLDDFSLYLMSDGSTNPYNISSSKADQWAGQWMHPIRSHSIVPTSWAGDLGLTIDINTGDGNELHSATEILVITLIPS